MNDVRKSIEYADFTWNPTHGCRRGCSYCWAGSMAKRLAGMGVDGYDAEDPMRPTFHRERLDEPARRKKPAVIAVSFMGDLFDPDMSTDWIDATFRAMAAAPQHVFLLLTRRARRMAAYFSRAKQPSHIWPGVTMTGDGYARSRLTELNRCKAPVRWVSAEPLQASLRVSGWLAGCDRGLKPGFNWLVIGAQTSPGAKPPKREWIESLYRQCDGLAPVFTKANVTRIWPDLDRREWPCGLPAR